jgi:predicted esterase
MVFARVVFCSAIAIPIVSWLVLPKHRKFVPGSFGSTDTTQPRASVRRRTLSTSLIVGMAPVFVFLITLLSLHLSGKYYTHQAETALRETLERRTESRALNRPNRELVGEIPEDIADVPALDLRAGGDELKRYFLIGHRNQTHSPDGYRLLLVLPGGHGGASFSPFIRRFYKRALDDRWLVAQLVAPEWDNWQIENNVWPRNTSQHPSATFTTEEFSDAVIADVRSREHIAANGIYLLAWSSGGPAAYSIALQEESPVAGAFIAMSVFRPDELPSSFDASGKSFYLFQSPDDKITRFDNALRAESTLRGAGARLRLEPYAGGHGWHTGLRGIAEAFRWLEEPYVQKPEK